MKKTLFYFVASILLTFYAGQSFGQCTPDPLVTDPEGNGEMVPDTVEAIETVALDTRLTIFAPDTATVAGSAITIHHITVKSLLNKPAWLAYACNTINCEFYGAYSNCVQVTGTPPAASAGFYPVDVLVDVYVSILGTPVAVQTNYNSGMQLIVWVHPASWSVTEFANKKFGIIPPQPNPYANETKIGCYTEDAQNVSLKVMDLLGKEVYSEKLNTNSGENYFRFNGSNLNSGVYFYSVIDAQNHVITKKMIKAN